MKDQLVIAFQPICVAIELTMKPFMTYLHHLFFQLYLNLFSFIAKVTLVSADYLQVYPDVGVAAMLQNSWKDTPYAISSLTDRRPVEESDDLIVLAAPDPQGEILRSYLWATYLLEYILQEGLWSSLRQHSH